MGHLGRRQITYLVAAAQGGVEVEAFLPKRVAFVVDLKQCGGHTVAEKSVRQKVFEKNEVRKKVFEK